MESAKASMAASVTDNFGDEIAFDETQFEIIVRNDSVLRSLAADSATKAATAILDALAPDLTPDERHYLEAAATTAAAGRDELEWLLKLPWAEKRVYRCCTPASVWD
jgi:hypothetical protein